MSLSILITMADHILTMVKFILTYRLISAFYLNASLYNNYCMLKQKQKLEALLHSYMSNLDYSNNTV